MRHRTIWLLIGIILMFNMFPLSAQFDGEDIHHVIISIDTRTEGMSQRREIPAMVTKVIRCNNLLRPGDYYSVLQYSAYLEDRSFQNYVRIPHGKKGETFAFHPLDSLLSFSEELTFNWDSLSIFHGNAHFSLSSVAKPYSIKALMTNEILVNKTYIILVTDHQYNGHDFYQEVDYYEKQLRKNNRLATIDKKAIMQPCFDVAKEYFMEYKETLSKSYANRKDNDTIYIDLYECVPLCKNITLPSVMFYPPIIKAKRVKRKGYQISLPMTNINKEGFSVKKLVFKEIGCDSESRETVIMDDADSVLFSVFRPKDSIDSISVQAWLNVNDGVYGATVLSPDRKDSPGLSVKIPVEYEAPATIIFGIPLPDVLWWFDEDQHTAAAIFNTIFWVIVFVCICLSIICLRHYRPKDSQIHLQ